MPAKFHDVAVYIEPSHDNSHLYAALSVLTENADCHVTGIYAITPIEMIPGEVPVPMAVLKQLEDSASSRAEERRQEFETEMKHRGIRCSWVCQHGAADQVVADQFRYADIGLLRQADAKEPSNYAHTLNHVLMNSGRPVLVIPYIGAQETIGKRTIVGWNSSVQCARAVHDAMPWLEHSDWVQVVEVDHNVAGDRLGSSTPIAEHLARHGIAVEAGSYQQSDIEPGDILINLATDRGADLIVAGAWGHTRAREYVFGGATRTLLDHMTVPVLFSH